jgi:hypothetical protein
MLLSRWPDDAAARGKPQARRAPAQAEAAPRVHVTLFSVLGNLVASRVAAYFSPLPTTPRLAVAVRSSPGPLIAGEVGDPPESGRVMKKPRPPVSYDIEDGLAELRAMAAVAQRKRAQTGAQAAISGPRKLGIAPGA